MPMSAVYLHVDNHMIVAPGEDDGERKKGEEQHSKKAKDWLILNKTFTIHNDAR